MGWVSVDGGDVVDWAWKGWCCCVNYSCFLVFDNEQDDDFAMIQSGGGLAQLGGWQHGMRCVRCVCACVHVCPYGGVRV